MSNPEKTRRSRRDRRPTQIPHHPKALTAAWIIAIAAVVVMGLWFWAILTGQGLVVTAEERTAAANAELEAEQGQQAAEVEEDQEDPTPEPVVIEPDDIEVEPPAPSPEETPTQEPAIVPTPDIAAPTSSDTVTDQWDLAAWSVLSYNGQLVVSGNLKNLTDQDLSGLVRVKVYNKKKLVATAEMNVMDFPANGSERVQIESDDIWSSGSKTLVLEFVPQ